MELSQQKRIVLGLLAVVMVVAGIGDSVVARWHGVIDLVMIPPGFCSIDHRWLTQTEDPGLRPGSSRIWRRHHDSNVGEGSCNPPRDRSAIAPGAS